ncbi:MAG: extensin family protein [Pseudomonadota bacterium]
MRRLGIALLALALAASMVLRPEDVPPSYAPWVPLDLTAAPNAVTWLKLRRLDADPAACRRALAQAGAAAVAVPDREVSPLCHIRGGVELSGLSRARLSPVATRCGIAARLYLWERHDLQPAALAEMGSKVAEILHYQSYSCRAIRTSRGTGRRMSEHATANAFDIAGFALADGRRLTLRTDWSGPAGAFLRAARDGLCRRFRVVLGPDYNALHADHFHVDQGRFLTCR